MEPRIQYAKTRDGVSIAFAEAGEGRPLISVPTPAFSHASKFRVAIYDPRGSGLSDRDAIDFSMEAMIRDLEAVVARTGFDSFALAAWTSGVPIAVTYAVAHPERVSHLILCDGWTRFSDFEQSP